MVWGGDSTGVYSVRSGYYLLLQGDQALNPDTKLFSCLWAIKCPQKIKIHVWRLIWQFVPTRYCLYSRRIISNPICPLCNLASETVEHAMCECYNASMVWSSLGIFWPIQVNDMPFKEWLSWLFESLPVQKHVLIVTILWSIWHARNKQVHDHTQQSYQQICVFISSYCKELENLLPKLQGNVSNMKQQFWQGPSPNLVKANFDASFSAIEKSTWSGVVIRDFAGEVLGACRRFTPHVSSAFLAEAFAALHAIELLLDLGFDSAIVEGDSLTVIKKLQSKKPDLSILSALIFDIKEKARSMRICRFVFAPRASNRVAHLIAGDSSLESIDRYWVEETPSSAVHAVVSDRQHLNQG
ncbi:hypothetical protein like AT3G09510 [Hibiscus trionum]|uniref:RNase H type-1 domain-containing protein n=1 Tax=Hibiscus trionum TaxID=183268 RepID=A0A9W7LTR1_HIBTR|nr:hypothetical protein like AT3G09510 [Hibiscus trionum]